jgi:hypothetical protein
MHIAALGCCEKQMNDARIIQYISNVLHAASRLKQCGLTLVKIASRRQEPQELFTCSNHIQTILRLLQSLSRIKCRIKSRTQVLAA